MFRSDPASPRFFPFRFSPFAYEISSVDAIKGRRISMNLCLNAFVIQFPDGLLDTCSVSAPRALLLPYAHRGHCKDEDGYKE